MTSVANRKKKLSLYTLAASTVAAASVQAAPTPSPNAPASFTTPDGDSNNFEIDINGDGTIDFGFFVEPRDDCTTGAIGRVNLIAVNSGAVATIIDDNEYAASISVGSSIPEDVELNMSSQSQNYLIGCDQNVGEFGPGESGFVGLEFLAGNNTHYGYLEVEFEEGSITTNILEACYEDVPGAPIRVGACNTSPIPVNGVVIPLTLALMAMGGMALRRRRASLKG